MAHFLQIWDVTFLTGRAKENIEKMLEKSLKHWD